MAQDNSELVYEEEGFSLGSLFGWGIAMLLLGLILGGYSGYQFQREKLDLQAQTANASNAENYKMNQAFQKRVGDIQIKISDTCIAKGGIPVFMNQNVDCKLK